MVHHGAEQINIKELAPLKKQEDTSHQQIWPLGMRFNLMSYIKWQVP